MRKRRVGSRGATIDERSPHTEFSLLLSQLAAALLLQRAMGEEERKLLEAELGLETDMASQGTTRNQHRPASQARTWQIFFAVVR